MLIKEEVVSKEASMKRKKCRRELVKKLELAHGSHNSHDNHQSHRSQDPY